MRKSNQFIEAMSSDNLRPHLYNLSCSFNSVIKNSIGFLYDKDKDRLLFIYKHEDNYNLVYAASSKSKIVIPLKGRKVHTFYLFTEDDKRMQPEDIIKMMLSIIETGNRNLLQRIVARIFKL